MPFDESHLTTPQTAHDLAVEVERRRKVREYQAGIREPCPRHCHLAEQGIRCRRSKDCEHRRPAPIGYERRGGIP